MLTPSCSLHSHAAVNLGRKLFPLFALALDLPENYFDDKVRAFPMSFIQSS